MTTEQPVLRVHRRQYVLGPEAWLAGDDWASVRLGKVVLSHCPDLRLAELVDAQGGRWVLIGLALQTGPGGPTPAEEIAQTPTHGVAALRHEWAGRWALVSERSVYLDACGQVGCLVASDESGRPWMSSSPVLLHAICGNTWQPHRLSYQSGARFYPAPACSLVGASRLLPSQTIDPSSGQVSPVELMPAVPTGRGEDELLDEIAARFRTAFEHVPDEGKPLWLGLSSGGDSRVVLAAAIASGRDVRPFTWVANRTKLCDRLLAPQIARAAGLGHTEIRAGPIDRARSRLVEQHAGPRLSTGDAVPLLRGARLGLTGFCTGGQCMDAWKSTRERVFSADPSDVRRCAAGIASMYFERPGSFFARQCVRWLEHVAMTPVPGLNYQSRWAHEQASVAWQAAKEQLYDMQMLERFSVGSCGRLTSLMMALDRERRVARDFEIPLVERLAPAIAGFPRSPSDPELIGPMRAGLAGLLNPHERVRRLLVRATQLRKRALLRFDELRGIHEVPQSSARARRRGTAASGSG